MSYDAIVIGAGVAGLSIGWRAAEMGMKVLVLDRDDPPAGASVVAAGMLAPVTEATFGEENLLQLNLKSASLWPTFAAELSRASTEHIQLLPECTLHLAMDGDQAAQLQRLFEYQRSLDLKVEKLTSSACRALEPALHPSTRSGILAPEDRAVDPRPVAHALQKALLNAGGELWLGRSVTAIESGASPVVTLHDGTRLACPKIVVAAGCWSGTIDGLPESIGRSTRPVKGQLLRLHHPPGHPELFRHVLRTEEVYLVPRPGGEVIVGASVEEKGFDTSATAGAVLELLRAADEVIPGIRELQVTEISVGLRPGSLDNGPLLGPARDGLILATGHFRNGILLAPLTGEGIAGLLVNDKLPDEFVPFLPDRFE